jgi:GNAT superfamily N-acetyltransferase
MEIRMQLPPGSQLSIDPQPSDKDCEDIRGPLKESADQLLGPQTRFAVFARDETGVRLAGLVAYISGGWLYIYSLWVREDLRRRGIGRQLMTAAEGYALQQHCHSAFLDTFSFQAPTFYRKLGYEIFGTLDYPPDHQRFFMQKRLGASRRR